MGQISVKNYATNGSLLNDNQEARTLPQAIGSIWSFMPAKYYHVISLIENCLIANSRLKNPLSIQCPQIAEQVDILGPAKQGPMRDYLINGEK